MEFFFWILVVLAVPYFCFRTYNRLKRLHESAKKCLSTIEGYSGKRKSVLGDIASVVDKFAIHEQSTHLNVASLENALGEDGASVTAMLSNLTRAYPELKSDSLFLKNQEELGVLAEDLRNAQEEYDRTVERFNVLRNSLPTRLYAPLLGFLKDLPYSIDVIDQEGRIQILDRAYDDAKVDELRAKSVRLLAESGTAITKQSAKLFNSAKDGSKGVDDRMKESESRTEQSEDRSNHS